MHPLIKFARSSKIDEKATRPQNSTYEFQQGIWMGPNGPLCDDPDHIPQSKKFDIETGEDQKGQ